MQPSLIAPLRRTIIGSIVAAGGLALGAIALTPQSAQAALLARDLTAPGDGLLTRDTATGLDWLDITQTAGQSYEAVRDGFGGYTTQTGFRFATTAEFSTLFASALAGKPNVFISTPNTFVNLPNTYFAAREVNTLLGLTFQRITETARGRIEESYTEGYVLDSNAAEPARLAGVSSLRSVGKPFNIPVPGGGSFSSDTGSGGLSFPSQSPFPPRPGSFLVRSSSYGVSTPEPSVLLGGVAIALASLKKGRSKRAA